MMGSRETILAAVKANQPERQELPDISLFETGAAGSLQKFAAMLTVVGGEIAYVSGYDEITRIIASRFGDNIKAVSTIKELRENSNDNIADLAFVHEAYDVDVAILRAHFGVAENGAVWITESEMQYRVLPFVTQHLAVVINAGALVPTMHQAYDRISTTSYGFGAFIAGPSKTADIEQSLVIGAHGPRSMTVFVLNADNNLR